MSQDRIYVQEKYLKDNFTKNNVNFDIFKNFNQIKILFHTLHFSKSFKIIFKYKIQILKLFKQNDKI